MKTFFDVETTGKWNWDQPNNHPSQPRMVQLAALMTDDDGQEAASFCFIVKPDGWTIDFEMAMECHGITMEMAENFGVNAMVPLGCLNHMATLCKERVAFNIDFDDRVVESEITKLGKQSNLKKLSPFCVMKAMAPVCKMPKPAYHGNYNRNDPWKWPKLQEAYRHAFHKDFDGAHNALNDIRATAELYFWLKKRPAETQELLV